MIKTDLDGLGASSVPFEPRPNIPRSDVQGALEYVAQNGGEAGPGVYAPADAQYLTAASEPGLSAERAVIDTPTIIWDFSVPGQASASWQFNGLEALTDPEADRLLGWRSESATFAHFKPGTGLGIVGEFISITDPGLVQPFVGATAQADGTSGRVPAPRIEDRGKFMCGDGTWKHLPGGGDLLSSNNLSDLADAPAARENLGLIIGEDVQAHDATLDSLSSLGTTADRIAYTTGVDSWAETPLTAFARSVLDDSDAATARATLGAQAQDADLDALAGLATTGFASRTGSGTWATRTLTGPAAGLTITNGNGGSGNPAIALANDLAALENLGSTGFAVRTGADAWAQRTITGTTNELTVTNGNGVSGNPTLSLPSALAFGGKTITGGTYSSPAAITGLPDPTNPQDAATKAYVDAVIQGLDPKPSVRVATTTNITLSGLQAVDGITVSAGDRVLVKNQSSAPTNGILIASAGAWTRAADFDAWVEIPGAFCFVEDGTTNAGSGWVCTSKAGGTLGTTAVTWSQFSGGGSYTAGVGLTLTGNQFAVSDPELLALSSVTSAANALPYFTGAGAASTTTLTSFGRSLIDDADAAAARTTLSLGSLATLSTATIATGGTGQTTAPSAFNALSPMTTAGDIIIGGVSGAGTRLGIGSAGQVLTVISGAPAWGAAGGSGEANTASNVGTAGVGVFEAKTGVNLGFRNINAASASVTVTYASDTKTVDVDVSTASGSDVTAATSTTALVTPKALADAGLAPSNVARLNQVAGFTKNAFVQRKDLAGSGNIYWDWDDAPMAYLELSGNATLMFPSNIRIGSTAMIIVSQNATGGKTLAFSGNFIWVNYVVPSIGTAPWSRSLLAFTPLYENNVLGIMTGPF